MTTWNHTPDLPLGVNPLFERPLRIKAVARWYIGSWLPVSINLAIVALAFVSLWFFAPDFPAAAQPGWWMLTVLLRNAVLVVVLAGALHWWFHGSRKQGLTGKFDPRPFPRKGKMFTGGDQVRDNVTWTMLSAVPIWSALEYLIWISMARGWAPIVQFHDARVWFVLVFFLIPIWESFYFYWVHRALHSPWLYRFHALHHRNTDVGPWSGLSMHPVEHVLYFGSVFIHFIVPTHPVHMVCHLMYFALTAVITHTGFEGLWLAGRKRVQMGTFHHQMHHRFFECNYGSLEMPWDKAFGTFHDGTDAAGDRMRDRIKSKRAANLM